MTSSILATLFAVTLTPASTEVVIEKGAVPIVRFAADEMTNYLSRVFGAAVPLVNEPTAGKTSVMLGDSAWSRAAGLDASKAGLDAFYTKAEGDRLYICGKDDPKFNLPAYIRQGGSYASLLHNERATVHGVYCFLEDCAGVRFYWPDEELGVVTPRRTAIEVPEGCEKTAPLCTLREPYMGGDGMWFNAKDAVENGRKKAQTWLRLRMGSYMIPCNHGTRFFHYVERFGKTHPEYFRLREDGSRHIEEAHTHLCWSNPGLREEMYQDVKAYLTGQPASSRGLKSWERNCKDGYFVDIMPDDGYQNCNCADCQKAYAARKGDTDGYASDLVWGVVAEIGRRLQTEGIKGEVVNLAYYPYLSVPSVDLPNNIRVMVAEYGPWSCGDPAEVKRQHEEIRAWTKKVGQRVWIWTYPNKHGRLDIPGVPSLGTHYWATYHNAISDAIFGLFAEAESDRTIYNYLSYQVMKEVMWKGRVDADALLAEHDRLMFGPAAADVHELYALLEEKWTKGVAGRTVQTSVGPQTVPPSRSDLWNKVYSGEVRAKLGEILTRAESKVAPDSLEAKRLKVVRAEFLDLLNEQAEKFKLHCSRIQLDRHFASDDPSDAFEICHLNGIREHGRRAPLRARAHVWKTATDLEVRYSCEEPDFDRVLVDKDRRADDPEIWHDNGVEFFVNPSGDRMTYYHFVLTSGNVLADSKDVYQSGEPTNWGWNSGAKTFVTRTATGWDAALTIPLACFGEKLADVVPMNFCRTREHADGAFYAMSSREAKHYHDVEDFGPVDFREGDFATNVVMVTDLFWYPYVDARSVDPKATFRLPALLCRDHALSRRFWGRMPKDKVIVSCTSGNPAEPPPGFFLARGFRVEVDGKEIPLKTEPSLGAKKVLELRPTVANPRNSEGDFIRLKDGTLLLAWSRYYEGGKEENGSWDNGGCDIGLRRSSDEGLTWSETDEILVKNDAMNLMSPSFVRLLDGRLALFYLKKLNALEDRFLVRFSSDEAKTWTEPVDVTAPFEPGWYVCNHARVIQLSTGRLVVPFAHHHRTADGKDVTSEATLVCALSDDGGLTWRAGARVDVTDAAGATVVTQEPGVIELKDGRVMMWTRTKSGSQFVGYSRDGGETWGPFGPTDLVGPCSPASIKRLATGELVAVWNDQREHPELREGEVSRRSPLSIALSCDDGHTWSRSVTLEENLSDFLCYTAIYEHPKGLLLAYCTQSERALDTLRVTLVPYTGFRSGTEVRPYEMDWASRTADEFPPVDRLESAAGWKVSATEAEAEIKGAADRRLFGAGVLRLTYRSAGAKPVVRLAPEKPIPCTDGFDTVSVWIYGNKIWGKDVLFAEFVDVKGDSFEVPMDLVRHEAWHCQLGVVTPDLAARAAKGATFTGFRLKLDPKTPYVRLLDFTSLCLFRDPKRPLPATPRAKRGVQLFKNQDQGHNVGPDTLPFPNRVETIVPPRREVKGLEFRLPKDGSLDWSELAFRLDGGAWIPLAKRGGLYPAASAAGAKVHFEQAGNSVIAWVEAPAGVREVLFGAAELPKGSALVGWPYYTMNWCDKYDIPGYEKGGVANPKTATVRLGDRTVTLSAMFDWTQSSAFAPTCRDDAQTGESQLCCGVIYVPKTDGTWNPVFERFVWTVAEKAEDAFPVVPNPDSPWKKVAGTGVWRSNPAVGDRSFNRDYWRRVKALGIEHLIVTDHETGWRDGNESFTYRTRTAPAKGGDEGQRAYARFMIDEMGFRYGAYTGLCDFPPVNEFWSLDCVARRWNGSPVQGWQRCYVPKSTWTVTMGEKLPPAIQEKFGFNTAYCDVHTCKSPWSCADCDARAPGAATFAQTFYDYGEVMLMQKRIWNGPVYSEGGFHWWYCGLVDGNYAQDYTCHHCDDPWLVDFDLARLHDKSCNFGMGSPKMFYRSAKVKPDPVKDRERYLMRFLAATLAFGHPGYLACVTDPINVGCNPNDLECEEVSYFLVQGIAAKYTQVSVKEIRYGNAEGRLLETPEALLTGAYRRSQVKVVYADGTEVAVNGSETESFAVSVKGTAYLLPPNGWAAVSGDGKAGSMNILEGSDRVQRGWSEEYDYSRRNGKSCLTRTSRSGAVRNGIIKDI